MRPEPEFPAHFLCDIRSAGNTCACSITYHCYRRIGGAYCSQLRHPGPADQKTTGGTEKPSFEIFKDEDTKIRLFDFNEDHQSRSLIQLDSNGYYKEVFIAIYDLKKLDRYLLELYNLGYRDYTYMEYRNSVYQRTKAKARDEAIENAKEKPGQLAASLNISLGKAYQVEELGSEDHNWYNIRNKDAAATLTHRLGSGKYLVEPGYITITSRVRVSFLIL